MDLLPLLFTTALVAYLLALGSADLARSIIRVLALLSAAFCMVAWSVALLSYGEWGQPVIDDFYATSYLESRLGSEPAGLLLLALGVVPICMGLFEMWRLKTRTPSLEQHER
ncbi:hypothetical protein [Pelagibius sp.]|uniref:hypothetical protein n=1 Tax=Pelagibius sp. TaxID=1931238 RepID=UPI003BB1908F